MRINNTVFSKFLLIIAASAALASIVLALIIKTFTLPVQISLAVLVISLALFAIINPNALKTFLHGRQAKYGSNSVILTIAVLGILIVLNLLGFHNTVRWDLTEDKSNTLADQTIMTLKSLNEEVFAQAFFSGLISNETAFTLLENYKANAGGKFDYQFIDPNEDPVAANNAGITRDGTIVLNMGSITEIVTTVNEESLTSAIIRLKSPEQKIVYVLTGHGEPSFSSNTDTSYYYAYKELESKNYTISELNLIAENSIPLDAVAVFITGPTKPLSENEVALIKQFVDKGGSLLLLYEPSFLTDFGKLNDPLSLFLQKDWGLILENDLVIDLTADPPSMAVTSNYGPHAITRGLENMVSIFPTSRSITISSDTKMINTKLAETSTQSWSERDISSIQNNNVTFDETSDVSGPLVIAAAFEDSNNGSRIVAFGDSQFASNSYYNYYANADLFINAVDWVAGQDEIISLTAKNNTERLLIAPSGYGLSAILFGVIIIIPLLIILTAIFVFSRRRREV